MIKTKVKFSKLLLCGGIFFISFVFFIGVNSVQAATVYSNSSTGNDTTGDGSLGNPYKTFHKAYTMASANDTVDLTGTFDWSDAEETGDTGSSYYGYTLAKNLTIQGQGSTETFLQPANSAYTADRRIFSIGNGITITIKDLTLRYGYFDNDNYGGTAIWSMGNLTLLNVMITENANPARFGGGALSIGGSGAFIMRNSTLYNNGKTDGYWRGYTGGMSISSNNSANEITNCTFYDNRAEYNGAIYASHGARLIVTNSTFVNNWATVSGIDIHSYADALVYLKNNIFADRATTAETNLSSQYLGGFVDGGYNIIETQTNGGFTNGVNGNLVGDQASLNIASSLALNSASNGVYTLALESDSVAINAGDPNDNANNGVNIPLTDQRRFYRNGRTDIGAFEYDGVDSYSRPTTQASNVTFSSVSYSQMDIGWTNGDGMRRVVFVKQANTGTASPVDDTTYTASSTFGSGTQIGSTGWYAVYSGSGTSVTVTGLDPSTDYIVQVFEYSGDRGEELYLTDTNTDNPKTQASATVTQPTTQSNSITISSVAYTSMTVSWSNGNGEGRIAFIKQANTGTATPVDDTTYTASSTFGSGTQIGSTGWYAIYKGTGTSVNITGLSAQTDYIVQVFEYNGTTGIENYLTDTAGDNPKVQSTATVEEPSTQASEVSSSSVNYTSMTASWSNGNGAKRVVFAKQANTGTATPVDDTTYTASSTFGSGTQIGSTGWYCVYNSTGISTTISNLTPNTEYIFQVFEYNESGSIKNYNVNTNTNNPNYQATADSVEPTTQASSISFSSVSSASMTVSWSNGNGEGRIAFIKQANAGTASPVDDTTYTASSTFGSGTQIGSTGWYAIYKGTGTSVNITGLSAQTDYIVQVFEYNGTTGIENYLTDTAGDNPNYQSTADAATEVVLGSGTSITSTSGPAPINIWYKSNHGQSIYTAAEINAAGGGGPITITQVGFYVEGAPANALPNFVVRMKHTADTNVASWQTSSGMTTVYSTSSYQPTAGGFDLITLDTPFVWNGTDNIVIDTAFSLVNYSQTGIVRYYSSTNGYRYTRSDSSDQTNVFSGGSAVSNKPQMKLVFGDTTAPTITSVSSNKANGSYKAGEVIDIDVTFSEAVTSTGDVTVTLETGDVDRTCTFSVSNSITGTCNYTVQTGDETSDLNVSLISGIIADSASNVMVNFSPTTNLAANKNLIIDTTAPSTPIANPSAGTYSSTQTVSLSSTGSSTIYYTTNGDNPTISSTLYSSAISIGNSGILKALAVDLAGNESSVLEAVYVIQLDSTEPEISNISTSVSSNSVTITWTTNEETSSQVEYGVVSSYGVITPETDTGTRVTNHSVTINNLQSCVRYYYRVKSKDSSNNQGVSIQSAFNTSGCTVSSISSGSGSAVQTSGGTVSLDTNNGRATINAPANFYSEATTIQINKLNLNSAPTAPTSGSALVADNFFELKAILGDGSILDTFDEAVTFTVSYNSETEDAYQESTLDVYRYENGAWTAKNCVLDTGANTLTCSLPSFSTYGVFGAENENEELEEADVDSWKAYLYDKPGTSCVVRLRLEIKGDDFDSNAKIKIGRTKAYDVDVRKGDEKIVARFCFEELLKAKNSLKRSVSVTNPDTNKEKAKKKIDLSKIGYKMEQADFSWTNLDRNLNIQKALVQLRFLDAQYTTGYYGSITTEAIQNFQAKFGLQQNGQFDSQTEAKILKELD